MPTDPGLLFVYGTLKPGLGRRDDDPGVWTTDALRGRLYDLGPYPGLVDLDDPSAGWVEGFVRPVTARELLEELDPYEAVDQGLYARLAVEARSGRAVWVYVYNRVLPATARGPIASWPPAHPVPNA